MKYPENFEILTPTAEEHAEVWTALAKAGCPITDKGYEKDHMGSNIRIKHSTVLGYAWTSELSSVGQPKPVYTVAGFKAAFPSLFRDQATMDDLIRMVSLDQELGCMQAEMYNLQEMIDVKQAQLKDMQKKFNIAP